MAFTLQSLLASYTEETSTLETFKANPNPSIFFIASMYGNPPNDVRDPAQNRIKPEMLIKFRGMVIRRTFKVFFGSVFRRKLVFSVINICVGMIFVGHHYGGSNLFVFTLFRVPPVLDR